MSEKREGYQVICDEDGKYKVFKVSKVLKVCSALVVIKAALQFSLTL